MKNLRFAALALGLFFASGTFAQGEGVPVAPLLKVAANETQISYPELASMYDHGLITITELGDGEYELVIEAESGLFALLIEDDF